LINIKTVKGLGIKVNLIFIKLKNNLKTIQVYGLVECEENELGIKELIIKVKKRLRKVDHYEEWDVLIMEDKI